MDTEIELKLLIPPGAADGLADSIIPSLGIPFNHSTAYLSNTYYDTDDLLLSRRRMGLRVRTDGESIEQTIKTAGKVSGGLHSRPEYNIALTQAEPDLHLFAPELFEADDDIQALNSALKPLFTTHVTRECFDLQYPDGTEIELVFDAGEVSGNERTEAISELELELKAGNIAHLFALAARLSQSLACRFGAESKAARGYRLVQAKGRKKLKELDFVPLEGAELAEQGFLFALERLQGQWQEWEDAYMQERKIKYLRGLYRSMAAVLQLLQLYQRALPCKEMAELIPALSDQLAGWNWMPTLVRLKELSSRKGPYRKLTEKSEALQSFLAGHRKGMLNQYRPDQLIQHHGYFANRLALLSLLHLRPWREHADYRPEPLNGLIPTWLANGWDEVRSLFSQPGYMPQEAYLAAEPRLRQTMYNGLLLSGHFGQQRDDFRRAWLDILGGMDELSTLVLLRSEIALAELDDAEESAHLLDWCEGKIQQLLEVMEQSRTLALGMQPYWA